MPSLTETRSISSRKKVKTSADASTANSSSKAGPKWDFYIGFNKLDLMEQTEPTLLKQLKQEFGVFEKKVAQTRAELEKHQRRHRHQIIRLNALTKIAYMEQVESEREAREEQSDGEQPVEDEKNPNHESDDPNHKAEESCEDDDESSGDGENDEDDESASKKGEQKQGN